MKKQENKIALVTGSNRGLGREACRWLALEGYPVILTSRDKAKGQKAADDLANNGLKIYYHQLDVNDMQSIQTMYKYIEDTFGRLDILINNAGVFLDTQYVANRETVRDLTSPFEAKRNILLQTFEINTLGPFFMCQTFIPLMIKNGYGRIVNVSSSMGQLNTMESGWTAYRISKTALNAVTRIFAHEVTGKNILINSVHPGWVKTDMGGPSAPRSIEEGVETIVWAATLPDAGPNGQFLRDKQVIEW